MAVQAIRSNVLQQFVQRAHSLYSLPAVAMEVLELTGQPNVDTAALRECVERDPALTGKLLRVVNSSMFGLSREVSDLTQALALLGVKPLKLLVLGFSLPKELYTGVEAETLQRFWQFTLVKAVAARELSKAFWRRSGDDAFIAALLQEIGILVLVNELGDSYVKFLSSVHEQGADLAALETATLGFDHAILSARLLDHWSLPEPIVQAVAVSQDKERIDALEQREAELPQILHLATLIASIIIHGRHAPMSELLDAATRYRGIQVEQIENLLDRLQEQVEMMANMFSVRVDQQQSFRDIMSRAHQQMAETAFDALPDMVGTSHASVVSREQEALHNALDQYAQSYLDMTPPATPGVTATPTVIDAMNTRDKTVSHVQPRDKSSADPGLRGRITAAISSCRSRQRELSLMLVEIDDYDHLLIRQGPERTFRIIAVMQRAIESLSDSPCECQLVSDSRCAVLLPDCDRRQAVTLARTLLDAVPAWVVERIKADTRISCSAGVATLTAPSRSSQPDELTDAADRCLFAARRSGGSVVKSIDVM